MLQQSWKKVYSRTTTKSNPLLHPEHGFCQQNGPEHGQLQDWYPDEEIVVVPICLNGRCCSSWGESIVSYWQRWRWWISAFSSYLKTYCQCNFSEIFKRRHIILEPCRKSKYPIRCLLWCHKTLSGSILNRLIQNPFKHQRWSVFAQTVNTSKSLTGYRKKLHLTCLKGFWIFLCCKTRQVKGAQMYLCTRRRYVKYKSTGCVFWNIWMILASVWLRNVRFENYFCLTTFSFN